MPATRPVIARSQLLAIFAVVLLLGFFFTIQVRSQASAQRYLGNQDNVSLGLLITGLSQANNRLLLARVDLAQQEQRLAADLSGGDKTAPALQEALTRLQIINGVVPVHGPGIEVDINFSLQAFELQDMTNAMRQLGAEALSVNERRVISRTVIGEAGGKLTLDGISIKAPFAIKVVGDPDALLAGAKDIVGSLQPRGTVTLAQLPDLRIHAIVPERPEVYSSYGK